MVSSGGAAQQRCTEGACGSSDTLNLYVVSYFTDNLVITTCHNICMLRIYVYMYHIFTKNI